MLRRPTRSLPTAAASALQSARYEVLPTAKAEELVLAAVPTDVPLTVTASASKRLQATLDLTERLTKHGYSVVPHLAARMVSGRAELAEIVDRLSSLGITDVFCPAGDADPPAGDYPDALSLLRDLADLGRPFPEIGITGYPESHPSIHDDVTIVSMWDKRLYATYIVSNLCFDPGAVKSWLVRLRRRGVDLPVLVGLPGPVDRAKLVSVATRIGVGQSVKFLKTHKSAVARMTAPGSFSPERFLRKSAGYLGDERLRVAGLHIFTFNQIVETEQWRERLLGE
jgi:methylenetetrahydrofolate reductase (NADPH)